METSWLKRVEVLKKALIVALVNIVALGAILVILELRERHRLEAWPFEPPLYVPDYLTARDAPLRWRFSPTKGRNSLGLRNREIQPKRLGVHRVLFLGDSLIWSGETSSGELYTAVLEKRLNSRSGALPVEIINAGIPGYTTYQELEFLKIYGLQMKPDLVVLGFVFNDLYYKYLHRPSKNNLMYGDPAANRYRFDPDGFFGALFGWSYLAHNIAYRGEHFWKRRVQHRPTFPFEDRTDFYLAWKKYGW
ncbi:MAG TPA: GDSL-type esterase/lipase family protein, partial [Candidatus Binatia bacterium]